MHTRCVNYALIWISPSRKGRAAEWIWRSKIIESRTELVARTPAESPRKNVAEVVTDSDLRMSLGFYPSDR
jgi:hypothetical protein